ncbi:oligosaccharide flippase family protein [Candidatus Bathyarchaeota archaeon]|nr:oligosaccharide flippase family protein [Candidatus Bathyarchaeota archaeon]
MNNTYSINKPASNKVARNSAVSLIRFIATIPVPFLLVPFMLQKLGVERFGLWALASTLSAFVQLGDFGIGLALVKSVAQMQAVNNLQGLNRILGTALVLYTTFAGSIGLCGLLVTGILVRDIFRVPALLANEAETVVMGTVIIFCINLVLSIFTSVINGMQRMDVSNGIAFAVTILNAIGVVLVLSLGFGLRGLVVNNGISTIFAGLVSLLAVRKLAPSIKCRFWRFCWTEVKPILTYGVNIQITNIAGMAGEPLVKGIISSLAGIQFVTYYDVATRLINPLRSLFSQAISPLMPFAAESHAIANLSEILTVYRKSVRYIVLLALPLFMLISVIAPVLVDAWIGPGYEASVYTLRVLLVGTFVSIVSMPSYYVFLSTNVRFTMFLAVANGLLDILVCIPLGHFYGYLGVVVGFSLVIAVLSLVSILVFSRTWKVGLLSLFSDVPLRSILFSLGLAVFFWVVLIFVTRPGLFGLALLCLTFAGIYGAFLWYSKSISRDELRGLGHALRLSRND